MSYSPGIIIGAGSSYKSELIFTRLCFSLMFGYTKERSLYNVGLWFRYVSRRFSEMFLGRGGTDVILFEGPASPHCGLDWTSPGRVSMDMSPREGRGVLQHCARGLMVSSRTPD